MRGVTISIGCLMPDCQADCQADMEKKLSGVYQSNLVRHPRVRKEILYSSNL